NFIVTAPTEQIADQVGEAAERNRKELAKLWLGKELAAWTEPCPVRVTITAEATDSSSVFGFQDGVVSRRGMILEGPLDRIFADLLPHEMTHTILAEWRGRALPRWADEGAAMLSESAVSRTRHEQATERLLRTGHPMPLSELLPRLDYPKDVGAFYAQSFSLTDFLVTAGGRRKFLAFVAQGERDGWEKAANAVYGYKSVAELEQTWLRFARMRFANKTSDELSRSLQEAPSARVNRFDIKELLPDGPAPVHALVALDEEGRLIVFRKVNYVEPVTTTVKSKDGQTHTVTTYQERHSYSAKKIPNGFGMDRVQDAKGLKVEEKELRKRLKKPTVVLISADTQPIDPLYLRLYKEDTLVLVLPTPLLPTMFPQSPGFPQPLIGVPASPAERPPAMPAPASYAPAPVPPPAVPVPPG
ncbi:MAG: hypothetical protein ACRELF_23045, partial [Gemmataceae bacterium]